MGLAVRWQHVGHWAPPHAVKGPENEVSVETNLLASYVVTKSTGPNAPHAAASVQAHERFSKFIQTDWEQK